MWLASVSLRNKRTGEIIGAGTWDERQWAWAEHVLKDIALAGAGDPSRERLFRMCITACLHRGVREDELALVPQWWHTAEAIDIAGGPIEIRYSKGIPEIASAMPCHNPGRRLLDRRRPDLYFPIDCGQCGPCQARKNLRVCAI